MEQRQRIALLLGPPGLWLAVFFMVPLGIMAVFSFRAGSFGEPARHLHPGQLPPVPAGQLSSSACCGAPPAWPSSPAAFCILLAYPLAYSLVVPAGTNRLTLLTLIIVPAWTSYLLRIFAWKLILGSSGAAQQPAAVAGADRGSRRPSCSTAATAVIVTLIYVWVPFVALPIFAALERIDRRPAGGRADLGCRPWRGLSAGHPAAQPAGGDGRVHFVFIPTLGEFVTPLLVGGGRTGSMYGNLIQDQFVRALNWPMGSVISLAMLFLVVLSVGLRAPDPALGPGGGVR